MDERIAKLEKQIRVMWVAIGVVVLVVSAVAFGVMAGGVASAEIGVAVGATVESRLAEVEAAVVESRDIDVQAVEAFRGVDTTLKSIADMLDVLDKGQALAFRRLDELEAE